MNFRIGHGFDAHTFAKHRKLILGGVEINYEYGLVGHSDADAVIHAVCDALLGAAGLGDIGQYFLDTDAQWKDISSRILLREVIKIIAQQGYAVGNVDVTIVAQAPKISPYRVQMQKNLAEDMALELSQVNVKATTTEGMGFTGRQEGIAVYAVAIIKLSQ